MNLTLFDSVAAPDVYRNVVIERLADLRPIVTTPRAASKNLLPLIGGYQLAAGQGRGNENVQEITFIIGDYDAGEMSVMDAAMRLEDANISALVYTTPSHSAHSPRWRVVCPLAEPADPRQHQRLVSRLNGVLGGVLTGESWTLSQSYFIGALNGHNVHDFAVDGDFLDERPELDARVIHKPGGGGSDYGGPISSGRIAHRKEDVSIMRTPAVTMPAGRVAEYLDRLPNDGAPDWHAFNRLGMCVYNATGGNGNGFDVFDAWAARNPAYDANMVAERWQHWGRSPAGHLDARNLGKICEEMGGTMPPVPPRPPGGAPAAGQNGPSYTPPPPGAEHQDKIKASVFEWEDPRTIPPRDWIYGMHYIRKFLTATIAVGGAGKSANAILEAVSMAIGRDLLNGGQTIKKRRVWYFNSEDPIEELKRRVLAVMIEYGVQPQEIGNRLFLNSGRDFHLVVAQKLREGVRINVPLVDDLTAEIQAQEIDVLIIDPLVHTHEVDENSNGDVARVCEVWRHVAEDGNCSVELIHHTRKLNGAEADADSGRGGSAITGAVRHQRVINRVSADIAARHNIPEDERGGVFYFGVGEKSNLVPNHDKAVFRRLVSTSLGNGTPLYPDGDSIGVVTVYEPPGMFDGITVQHLAIVQQHLRSASETRRKGSPQARDWVGNLIAEVCDMDPAADKKRIQHLLKTWIEGGALKYGTVKNPNGNTARTVEVGETVL